MGRAGSYKYIDIDDIIDQAMDMARQIKDGGSTIRYPYMVIGCVPPSWKLKKVFKQINGRQ